MDIKQVAAILLIGRLASCLFMASVLRRQLQLFKNEVYPELHTSRKRLFALAITVFVGNIIPILIDVATIVSPTSLSREDSPSVAGVTYGFSNCITAVVSSALVWSLYRLAARTTIIVDVDKEIALDEKSQ